MAFNKETNNKNLDNITHEEDPSDSPPTVDVLHLADDVSYGPNGIRGLISSPYVLGAAFLASLGGFSFGYDQVCCYTTSLVLVTDIRSGSYLYHQRDAAISSGLSPNRIGVR